LPKIEPATIDTGVLTRGHIDLIDLIGRLFD